MDKSTGYIVTMAIFIAAIVIFMGLSFWYGKKMHKKIQVRAQKRISELTGQGVPEGEARGQTLAEIQMDLERSQKQTTLILGGLWIVMGGALMLVNGIEVLNAAMVLIGVAQLAVAFIKKKK